MSGVALTCSRRTLSSRIRAVGAPASTRWYSSTRSCLEEEAATKKKEDTGVLRQVAREYVRRRAAYNRDVSELRKDYMEEYLHHKAEDEAQRDAERAETTRRRLERQRAKNERSVQNAIRQEELQRQNHLAFQDHLRVEQQKRDEKKELFTKARQLLIDELEEEAPLWLTSPEEVEAAFTPEAEQLLWARPQGVLGAPNPSLDSHFWQYESHTWEMRKTYKTQQDILLEEYEEDVYQSTNVDPDFWTEERVQAREELERKARLRANVRVAGRKSLLARQREFLTEESDVHEGEPPKPKPIPSLGVLSNIQAQEKEGAELLFKDPTKFFTFRHTEGDHSAITAEQDAYSESYSGPSLGAPIDIRDPLRSGSPQGKVFPRAVGKLPKPDLRSEKEKKRQEREEKLWAATQAQSRSEMNEIDLAADEDEDFGEPMDYDQNDDWDSDDEEWEKGLDPQLDSDILAVPRELRYREEDIDWVIQKLETKAEEMQSHVRNTINSMEQEARSRMDRQESEAEETQVDSPPFFDEHASVKLRAVGADVDKFERLMSSLSQEQLLSVFSVEAERREKGSGSETSVFEGIPGLGQEQIDGLIELESFLLEAERK